MLDNPAWVFWLLKLLLPQQTLVMLFVRSWLENSRTNAVPCHQVTRGLYLQTLTKSCTQLLEMWESTMMTMVSTYVYCLLPEKHFKSVCLKIQNCSTLLLGRDLFFLESSIYVYCVCSREEVCQYSNAILVPDQRSSTWRQPGRDSSFSSGHRWGDRDWNKKVAECKLWVSTDPFTCLNNKYLKTQLSDLK